LTGTAEARSKLEADASAEELAELVCPVDPSWRDRIFEAEARLQSALAL
jgi:hypothetical protein